MPSRCLPGAVIMAVVVSMLAATAAVADPSRHELPPQPVVAGHVETFAAGEACVFPVRMIDRSGKLGLIETPFGQVYTSPGLTVEIVNDHTGTSRIVNASGTATVRWMANDNGTATAVVEPHGRNIAYFDGLELLIGHVTTYMTYDVSDPAQPVLVGLERDLSQARVIDLCALLD